MATKYLLMNRKLTILVVGLMALSVIGSGFAGAQATTDSSNMEFQDQALGDDDSVVVENVTLEDDEGDLQNGAVIVTYEDDDSTVVAGMTDVTEPDGTDVVVAVDDTDQFPGDHKAHLLTEADADGLSVGDTVDPAEDALVSSEDQTVFDAEITLETDDIGQDSIDEITLTSVNVDGGDGDGTDYGVVVHPHDDDGVNASESLGETDVLNGSNENVTITLDENTETGATYTAMVHTVGDEFSADDDEIVDEPALLSYDSDEDGLTAVTSTADGGDKIDGSDDGFLSSLYDGNDLPLIGDLPVLGQISLLGYGLVLVIVGVVAVGGGYYYEKETEEEVFNV